MNSNRLESLINARLNAVVFVMDYLQIQFDIGIATFMEFPEVHTSNGRLKFGDESYRNSLCQFIGEAVNSIDFREGEYFQLGFSLGEMTLSLLPEKYRAPEMVVIDLPEESISF